MLELDIDSSCYVGNVNIILFILPPRTPPSKLFQDINEMLEKHFAERILAKQVYPPHPHFTVRDLAKEYISFTRSGPMGTEQVK